ncbi:MAG TPA: MFS transporter [Burkholderiales bacterium]|nr:MFS transporter [Burkholderiales bacterium]
MSAGELRAGASLAGVFGLRMLGLFLILPVFAVHAPKLAGGDNLTLVGIALGAYGLSQAILQIPFGMASDRWGRKPVIYGGLAIFAAGSFLAASAGDIWTAIAGRTLQGAGAISSVVVALAADLTREQHRTKIMAMIGAMIGLAFATSLVAAPVLYQWIGMGGLFVLTGALCLIAVPVVALVVPDVALREKPPPAAHALRAALGAELLRVNVGIFVLHLVQMAMFVVLPLQLVQAGLELPSHWRLYLPVVLLSFVVMVPAILYADRRNRPKPVMIGAIGLLIAVQLGLGGVHTVFAFAAAILAFFVAFNVLEALLPSLISRLAPASARGTAIGVYNTTQTLGLFFGGLLGGWVAKNHGTGAVYVSCALLSLLWLVAALGMKPVPAVRASVNDVSSLTFTIASGVNLDGLSEALARVRGVREAEVLAHERIARLKVVAGQWDESTVRKMLIGER